MVTAFLFFPLELAEKSEGPPEWGMVLRGEAGGSHTRRVIRKNQEPCLEIVLP